MKNIFCVGGATVDRKLKPSSAIIPATSNPVTSYASYGGVARNVAENLARWTHPIHLQCVVGDDDHGKNLLIYLQQLGINTETSVTLANKNTAHYYAVLTPTNDLHVALIDMHIYNDIPLAFVASFNAWTKESIVFIDTNLPSNILNQAITLAMQKQCLLCVDPVSVVKAKKLSENLRGVFLLKPNQFEAAALTDMPIHSIADCMRAGKKLLARGAENVVISLGIEGYVVVNATNELHVKKPAIKNMVDANGAGDAFIAGILYGLQQEIDILSACELGARAAALTVQSEKTVLDTITVADLRKDTKHATIF